MNEPGRTIAMKWVGRALASNGLFLFLLFTVLDVFIAAPVWHDWRLDLRGVETEAEPISVVRQGVGTQQSNTVTSHVIRVRFDDATGQKREGEFTSMNRDVFARAGRHDPLSIEYLPSDPTQVRLAGSSAALFGNYSLLPLAFGLLGLWLLWTVRREEQSRQRRAA